MNIEELNHFDLLEREVEALILAVRTLKEEKNTLEKAVQDQKTRIDSLLNETDTQKVNKKLVEEKVSGILEKIEKLNLAHL